MAWRLIKQDVRLHGVVLSYAKGQRHFSPLLNYEALCRQKLKDNKSVVYP